MRICNGSLKLHH